MKYLAAARCEMKYAYNICEANISQRSYFTLRSNISHAARRISLKKPPILYQDWRFFLGAGGGLEPPTSGLSLRASCGARKTLRAHSAILVFFDRCAKLCFLHPPPAAGANLAQRATPVGLIARRPRSRINIQSKKIQYPRSGTEFFGCRGRT